MSHQECTDQSSLTMISSSSSTPPPPPPNFWWDHATSLTSWMTAATTGSWHDHQSNPNSNSSCEEDIDASRSFSSASNYHTGLTVESLSRRLVEREPSNSQEFLIENASDTQIWSHILFGVGSNVGELHNGTHQDAGENFLDVFSSKSAGNNFEHGSSDHHNDHDHHYLIKKMDQNNWDQFSTLPISYTTTTSTNNNNNSNTFDSGRLTKLSSPTVSHLSIAPPDYQEVAVMNCQPTSNLNDHYRNRSTDDDHHHLTNLTTSLSCYNGRGGRGVVDHLKVDHQKNDNIQARGDIAINNNHHSSTLSTPGAAIFRRSSTFNSLSSSSPIAGSDNKSKINGYINSGLRTRLTKPQEDINHQGSKDSKPSLNLWETTTKQRLRHSSSSDNANLKRKRSGDTTSEAITKKAKNETSTLSSAQIQGAPKVKLSEKITTLQQIVSPFGRTDQASVLHEAIQYVKFLQEQVQFMCNPYMKPNNPHKDFWGGCNRKDKGDIINHDLRSKGLCLVPVSCTPQVCHENTGSDYWTPTYRGCLSYR